MNREDICKIAQKVGYTDCGAQSQRLHDFAAFVAAAEREECADACSDLVAPIPSANRRKADYFHDGTHACVKAIRARGN